ncbi:MAG: hemerythrin domain-containing protein [Actinomycetota bacterium]|nr:hemerythrin domain-containing protein [Actinomycetota bacterium]
MTITHPDTTTPGLVPVTFDLYRDIHKAVRVELFSAVTTAASTDPTDALAVADLASQVARLVDFLDLHAEHEDGHIQPFILDVLPGEADRIESDHGDFEGTGSQLVDRAVEATQAAPAERRQLLHWLHLDLAAFTSEYLAHQDLEERIVMPALEAAIGVDAVMGVHGAIIGSIPPDELMQSLALMIPAMNADDRTEMLGGMQATAPAEAFQGVWGLTQSVLGDAEVRQLAGRLGLS